MGITIGTLRDRRKDQSLTCEDVKRLTKDEAAEIYFANYGRRSRARFCPSGSRFRSGIWA